jgi:hypothetical protein
MNPNNNVIYQFVHNRRRQKVGVVLAKKTSNGSVGIGWSLCNPRDEFNKQYAVDIALGRAENFGGVDAVPFSLADDYNAIYDRAKRYFKDSHIIA